LNKRKAETEKATEKEEATVGNTSIQKEAREDKLGDTGGRAGDQIISGHKQRQKRKKKTEVRDGIVVQGEKDGKRKKIGDKHGGRNQAQKKKTRHKLWNKTETKRKVTKKKVSKKNASQRHGRNIGPESGTTPQQGHNI